MVTKETRARIEAQWSEQATAWVQKDYQRERRSLLNFFDDDENILAVVGCTWGPESAFEQDAGFMLRQTRLNGVAVVTDRSVYLAARKGLNPTLVTEMPLSSIESVQYDGGVVTFDCDGIHNWAGPGKDEPFQMRDIDGEQGRRVAELVQRLQTSGGLTEGDSPVERSSRVEAASPAEFAGMSKPQRIDAQWERGSLLPNQSKRGGLAGLLATFTGGNSNRYGDVRKKLYEVLADDEHVEYWLAGRWGKPSDFSSISGALVRSMAGPSGGNKTGHAGVAVTTDRRLLLISSGILGGDVVELSYEHIDTVDYNDGMIMSGVKFFGNNIDPYEFYHDHENKPAVKGRARRLAQSVRQHLDTLSDEAAAGEIE